MQENSVHFSIANHAQWAPGLDSDQVWAEWLQRAFIIEEVGANPPAVSDMPAMLRRRARLLGRMALEVAYACVGDLNEVPTIFCSRHGEVAHSIELIQQQIAEGTVSPIGFSSAVHNATAGLFSIARKDHSNHIAIAAGTSTIEHAIIEACGLLNDGATAVLLVHYEQALPQIFHGFEDCLEQTYAWAWLMVPAKKESLSLHWKCAFNLTENNHAKGDETPPGLQILRFHLSKQKHLERITENQHWIWSHNDAAT